MILARVKRQYALVYLDAILIFSESFDEHQSHNESILKLEEDDGVTLRLQKSRFSQTQVYYFVHFARPGTHEMLVRMIVTVTYFKLPTRAIVISSFLESPQRISTFLLRIYPG